MPAPLGRCAAAGTRLTSPTSATARSRTPARRRRDEPAPAWRWLARQFTFQRFRAKPPEEHVQMVRPDARLPLEARPLEVLHGHPVLFKRLGQWVAEDRQPTKLHPDRVERLADIVL